MRILDSRRLTGASLWLDRPGAILDVSLDGLNVARALAAWMEHVEDLRAAVGWEAAAIHMRMHEAGASLALEAPFDALYTATELNEAAWYAAVAEAGGDPALVGGENVPEDAPYVPRAGAALAAAETATHPATPAHAATLADSATPADAATTAHAATPADSATPADAATTAHAATPADDAAVKAWLRDRIAAERNPALVALAAAAARRGVTMLADDEQVSLGLGRGSRAWTIAELPRDPAAVNWQEIHDIPVALVTGTNGKSTTVRLLGAMARAAGIMAGVTSTDRVTVGDQVLASGDYSGPSGARTVVRDPRVEIAMLELARGGILRRGLAVPRVRVALVTNVDNDHLGEFGIFDLPALADAKLVVAKAVGSDGRVVLNADDPLLLERGRALSVPVLWFTLDPAHPHVCAHIAAGGDAALLDGEALVLVRGGARHAVAAVGDVPITFAGVARHNVANALAAIGVASALDLPIDAMRAGLASFANSPDENPGRANVWELGGLCAIVDYAHNPSGARALAGMVAALPAVRRGLVIGQAGDRSDDAIRAFVREAWAIGPDRVFVKDMEIFLRGREPGATPKLIEQAFVDQGARPDQIERHTTEFAAVCAALAWARAGDLLLLTTHAERERVIALLETLRGMGWAPGQPFACDGASGDA